jgi:pimeloyl-[acyl-carrier protein] methyl ester esterase
MSVADPLPLVCVHGWSLNGRVFDALRAALPEGYPLQTLDLPGHGGSPWRGDQASLEAQTDWLLQRLPPRCALLGWSLGGQLAVQAALQAPERIAALVLVASTPRFVEAEDWPHGMALPAFDRFAAGLTQDWQALVDDFLQLQVRGGRAADSTLQALRAALAAQGPPRPAALAAGLELLRHTDLRSAVGQLDLPALVIGGQHDRITPPAAQAWLAQALPQGRYVPVDRAGHAPFLSHPQQFAAVVQPFLSGLPL